MFSGHQDSRIGRPFPIGSRRHINGSKTRLGSGSSEVRQNLARGGPNSKSAAAQPAFAPLADRVILGRPELPRAAQLRRPR